MATKSNNVSLTPELSEFVKSRVRSGLYGSVTDVHRAGLRALAREEMAASVKRFDEIMAALPPESITPKTEQDIERLIKAGRAADRKKAGK